jgi:hypothetical protein
MEIDTLFVSRQASTCSIFALCTYLPSAISFSKNGLCARRDCQCCVSPFRSSRSIVQIGRRNLKCAGYIESRQKGLPAEGYDEASSAGIDVTRYLIRSAAVYQPQRSHSLFISRRVPTLLVRGGLVQTIT